MNKENLGCGKEFNMKTSFGFICGIPNGWGTEILCQTCQNRLKLKWDEEDSRVQTKGCKEQVYRDTLLQKHYF